MCESFKHGEIRSTFSIKKVPRCHQRSGDQELRQVRMPKGR